MTKLTKETPQMPLREQDQTEKEQTKDCELRWEESMHLWARSDSLVRELITHAKRGDKVNFQVTGMETLSSDLQRLTSKDHTCNSQNCESDIVQLEKITRKNIKRIKSEQTHQTPDPPPSKKMS